MKSKLKKGDQVQIMTGKDKGKKGRVLRIDLDTNKLIVEGLNLVKKTQRPKKQNEKGGIIEIEAAIAASNVQLLCRKCGVTRIGLNREDGKKIRVCRKCGEVL